MPSLATYAVAGTVILSLAAPGPAVANVWRPGPHTTFQWQLSGRHVDRSVRARVYDIDGFTTSRRTVRRLHARGRHVVCYMDAGTVERYRPDADRFPNRIIGRRNGWPGERWLDIRARRVLRPILTARAHRCAHKGFDAIEWDNVDGYANRTGFPLRGSDELRFNKMLARLAHARGMSVALKNDLGQVRRLRPYFDFSLDEQCFQYHECGRLKPFVDAGKAVFEVEYRLKRARFCSKADSLGLISMRKRLRLDAWRRPCRMR